MNENDEYKWEGRVGRETLFAGVAGLPCSSTAHNAITTPECTHAEESRAQWAPPPPPPAASCLDNEWRRRSDSPGMDQGRTFLESFESLSPLHQTVAQTAGLQYWRRIQRFIYLAECGLSFWNGNMNREIWFCFCPNHATILVSPLFPPKL